MTYFEEIDAWLEKLLPYASEDETDDEWLARLKKDIKREILDSYKRGKAAAGGKTGDEEKPRDQEAKVLETAPGSIG